jgi:hypothetical protein
MNCTWARKPSAPVKQRLWTFMPLNTIPGAQMAISPAEVEDARHEMLCGCEECRDMLQARAEEAQALMEWDTKGLRPV